jgi:uncharacterized protein
VRHAGRVHPAQALVIVPAELGLFLRPGRRDGPVPVALDETSSLGHVVESLGVPLTEVGRLLVNNQPAGPAYRPGRGDVVTVQAVRRPQHLDCAGFLLDVHLGTLARRLRLVGSDAAYSNDADDDALVEQANAARRMLLTKDRGLLRRRKLQMGAYVRGARADDQLRDVLDRFRPPLAPWTRCPACNGLLAPVATAAVDPVLRPGTRRTYHAFSRCGSCGQVYWHGAHSKRLDEIIDRAVRVVTAPAST